MKLWQSLTGIAALIFCGSSLAFSRLWKSIYGNDSWDQNPWVWVVEFRRVEQQAKVTA